MHLFARRGCRVTAVAAACAALALGLFACGGDSHGDNAATVAQRDLGYTTLPLITKDNLKFKDMNRNGQLDPYEDWRQPADVRARDLTSRLTLAEKAGLMMHGTAPALHDATGIGIGIGTGTAYDLAALKTQINDLGISTYITRMSADASTMAAQYNQIQILAE